MTILVFDIEANGFKPTEIFCICITDLVSRESISYPPDAIAEAMIRLSEADIIIGHYIRGYDCPVIEKLSDGVITFDKNKMIDTLDMSRALTSSPKHSLKYWGELLGRNKLEQPLFESYTPELIPYCERDVEITVEIFDLLVEEYLFQDRKKAFKNCELLEHYFAAIL